MLILGIETSCDETAAAVVSTDGRVLSSIVSSQIKTHAPFGGVVPELASRRHVQDIVPVIDRAMEAAGASLKEIGGVAVTVGPGLVGALMVGVAAAGALSWGSGIPAVGVNHIRGHLLAVFLRPVFGEDVGESLPPALPFIALVVSGGHTSLFQVNGSSDITLLGRTRDDAAGEALDKGAKVLGLGYPGGPEIEKCAERCTGRPGVRFPRGLIASKSLDFSFSGVKTALANHVRSSPDAAAPDERNGLCLAYQDAIVDVLVEKALTACRHRGICTLVVAGGVASNGALRSAFHDRARAAGVAVHIPAHRFCTDNAAMIAYAGKDKLSLGINETGTLRAVPNMGITDM